MSGGTVAEDFGKLLIDLIFTWTKRKRQGVVPNTPPRSIPDDIRPCSSTKAILFRLHLVRPSQVDVGNMQDTRCVAVE
jgi:hypothetical protein